MLEYISNLNLDFQSILLIISIVMNAFLGVLIFTKRSAEYVNRIYIFNIVCIVWWSVAIVGYRITTTNLLTWTTWLYVAPTFIASSFAYFSFFFPEEHPKIPFKHVYAWAIAALNALIVLAVVSPGVILESVDFVPHGEKIIHFGYLYIFYALYISGFFGLGLLILAGKLMFISDRTKKRQLVYLLWGYLIASTLAMLTNLSLPYLGYFQFNWLGQVLTVFMVLPVTYAIFKHRLFDVKVIATELITGSLWIFLLVRVLLDKNVNDRITDAFLLAIMIVIGWLLIRSVDREVEQRELIEAQEKELEKANAQQATLLHFISHEIKGYLTKGEAAFAEIVEDSNGGVSPYLKALSQRALEEMRKGVATVMDILDASNLKKGTVVFKKDPLDFKELVTKIIEEQRPIAYEKRLGFDVHIAEGNFRMHGDAEKLREHLVRNLIDNSIKYTQQGSVRVDLSDGAGKIHFIVQDTGVGITPEDMAHLFTEGGHGKDSIKVNVHSTGYGLFIAKQIVEAHRGTIKAESAGQGKGSKFIVELPVS